MTLLSPWSALIAAALAVPALLLLYFLKLRRQRLRIPSTLLWQKSFEDLQVNAPFQRLKWSMLLALQLLLLAAMLLALAEPVMKGSGVGDSQIVLLIDRSASMNARIETDADAAKRNGGRTNEPPRTRLDAAKSAARDMVDQLGRAGNQGQMMIIAFGRSARVVTTYQSDRSLLLDAIDSIEATDEEGDLDAALQLAGAYAGTRDESENQSPPAVVLLSDGGSGGEQAAQSSGDGKQEHLLRAGRFRFVQVSPEAARSSISDNVGITAIGARRDFENPAQVLIFARIINTAAHVEQINVTLMIDDQPAATIRKSIPAATDKVPGEASITHAVDLPGGAVLTLRLNRSDALSDDDTAAIVMPAPTRPRIALVHPNGSQPDQFLRSLLEAMEPQRLDVISFDAYQTREPQMGGADSSDRSGGAVGGYDLIVFDRVSAARLPVVPSLTFGGVPAPLKSTDSAATPQQGNRVLSWDRQHPIMRNVSLDTILYAGFGGYELPAGATALAYGPQGPIIATLRTRGERHVVVGFALVQSNWPLHVSFAVFLQNAVEYLTLAESGQNGLAFKPGEPISVRVRAAARTIQIRGPVEAQIPVEGGARTTLPPLRRAGLYEVDGAVPPFDRVAVSVLSDAESDIRPRSDVVVNDQNVSAAATQGFSPRALWPWLVGAAFALAAIEWLAYCRKLRGAW